MAGKHCCFLPDEVRGDPGGAAQEVIGLLPLLKQKQEVSEVIVFFL